MVNNLDYSAEGREAIAYILYEYQYDIWYDINRDGATLELRRRGQTDKNDLLLSSRHRTPQRIRVRDAIAYVLYEYQYDIWYNNNNRGRANLEPLRQ